MQPRRFILQALDPEYGHPAFETILIVERPEEVRALLGEATDNLRGRHIDDSRRTSARVRR